MAILITAVWTYSVDPMVAPIPTDRRNQALPNAIETCRNMIKQTLLQARHVFGCYQRPGCKILACLVRCWKVFLYVQVQHGVFGSPPDGRQGLMEPKASAFSIPSNRGPRWRRCRMTMDPIILPLSSKPGQVLRRIVAWVFRHLSGLKLEA